MALQNSVALGALTFLALWIFGDAINEQTPLISLGYGLVGILSTLPAFYLAFNHHWADSSHWVVRLLALPILAFFILIFTSVIYASLAYGHSPSDYFLLPDGTFNKTTIFNHVKNTVVYVFLVFVMQMIGARNEREIVVNRSLRPREKAASVVTLSGGTKSSNMELDINHFLYAESDANYLKIVFDNEGIQSATLRMTLKQFEEATAAFPQVARCHRAYMVNIEQISYLETGGGKGEAHFDVFQGTIPISKTYINDIRTRIQSVG